MARRPDNKPSGLTPDAFATDGEKALLAELRAAVAHFENDRGMTDSYAHQQLAALEARLLERGAALRLDVKPFIDEVKDDETS